MRYNFWYASVENSYKPSCIYTGTVVLRVLLFPVVVLSQRNAAKLNNNMPQVQYIQMKVTEARQRGDKIDGKISFSQ